MNQIIQIAALQYLDNGIGYNNQLIYKAIIDMKHFRKTTIGHIVVMGRKTFESIGKVLPHRINVVLTRNENYKYNHDLVRVFNNFDSVLKWSEHHHPNKIIYIIGGAEIYKQTLKYSNKLLLTEINHLKEANIYYPKISPDYWHLKHISLWHTSKDLISNDKVILRFVEYNRKY